MGEYLWIFWLLLVYSGRDAPSSKQTEGDAAGAIQGSFISHYHPFIPNTNLSGENISLLFILPLFPLIALVASPSG